MQNYLDLGSTRANRARLPTYMVEEGGRPGVRGAAQSPAWQHSVGRVGR